MRNALARIEFGQAGVDLGQKDQALDRIIERGVRRQILQSL